MIYSEEFKAHILAEHEAGVSVLELARRHEPSATTIQNWKRQAKAEASEPVPSEGEVLKIRGLHRRMQQLERENALLKKAAAVRWQGRGRWRNQAYTLIKAERGNFTVRLMCRVLEISESGYYAWRNRKPSRRAQENEKLLASIRGIMADSNWTYGSPRVAAQLRKNGQKVSVNRVARLMREAGLSASTQKRRGRTLKKRP